MSCNARVGAMVWRRCASAAARASPPFSSGRESGCLVARTLRPCPSLLDRGLDRMQVDLNRSKLGAHRSGTGVQSMRMGKAVMAAALAAAVSFGAMAAPVGQDAQARPMSGNPILPGWYADPEAAVFGKS